MNSPAVDPTERKRILLARAALQRAQLRADIEGVRRGLRPTARVSSAAGSAGGASLLLGGAIRFEGEMLDPPMFGKALQTLLKAHALHALSEKDTAFAIEVLRKLPEQVVRENWPYGVIL